MEEFLRSLRTKDGTSSPFLLMDKQKERQLLQDLITRKEQVRPTC
jgi:hypothetical protein